MNIQEFEKRKKDHIELSLKPENQAVGFSGLDLIVLEHDALPDVNFSEISLDTKILGTHLKTPLYINSMTAGHKDAVELNTMMARVCQERGWMMGVGSQRRQLSASNGLNEWSVLRKKAPKTVLIGNIGISQVITSRSDDIQRLVDSIEAHALFVHLNALQECLQQEGTPQFKGGLKAIEKLIKKLSVPVILKETGCGFSSKTMKRLKNIGLYAVDVSGLGGTHWGRIEGDRAQSVASGHEQRRCAATTFKNWGIGTVQSVLNGLKVKPDFELWASGGVRSGLDVAKLLVLGASAVGLAKPALEAALRGEQDLQEWMKTIEFELRTAMFVTGTSNIKGIKKVDWQWIE